MGRAADQGVVPLPTHGFYVGHVSGTGGEGFRAPDWNDGHVSKIPWKDPQTLMRFQGRGVPGDKILDFGPAWHKQNDHAKEWKTQLPSWSDVGHPKVNDPWDLQVERARRKNPRWNPALDSQIHPPPDATFPNSKQFRNWRVARDHRRHKTINSFRSWWWKDGPQALGVQLLFGGNRAMRGRV